MIVRVDRVTPGSIPGLIKLTLKKDGIPGIYVTAGGMGSPTHRLERITSCVFEGHPYNISLSAEIRPSCTSETLSLYFDKLKEHAEYLRDLYLGGI